MTFYRSSLFILTLLVLIISSCTKPVLIGSDFLDDEKASLNFVENFDLNFYTEKTDSVIVHSGNNTTLQLVTYLLGNIDEPVFGKYSAEIYAQPVLPTVATRLMGATLDSVVLQLRYDTLGNYGSLTEPVTIEVYRMTENPNFNQTYYSDTRFMTDSDISAMLGSKTFVPKPFDSTTVDTIKIAPSIRIPLSKFKLGDLTMQDSAVFNHQDSFLNYLNGLHIVMKDANNTNTMLGIDLLNATSGLIFYYDNGASMNQEFKFVFSLGGIKVVHMEHDYAGSLVEPSLTSDPESQYWFVQGLSGVTTKMQVNGLDQLGNVIINQAELEVYCTFPDGDNPALYPPIQYLVTQHMTDSFPVNSTDVNIALSRVSGDHMSQGFKVLYGGVLEEVTAGPPAVYKYTMKVTSQIKDIYEGKKENVIYFNPFEKPNVPNRSVMFGPGHPEFAPRLRIYYTAL
ncbi:MAG TPA: DUF4270 family protein [Saprospiraceae bacterium]|nr:DUF4270 family protein [Saprospiraceae bacterium]